MRGFARSGLGVALVVLVVASLWIPSAYGWGEHGTPFHKLGRGLKNMAIAPLEVPLALGNPPEKLEPISGEGFGLLAGLSRFFVREVSGIFETLTFLVPAYDKPFYQAKLGEPALIENPEE